ncbi:MAG: hypothetical protein LBH01_03905 [Verrucomicrobiales bacterium]|jgi:hypothetical protein|nr:hypothetical protein [Verrucomicrobiales bacterium]
MKTSYKITIKLSEEHWAAVAQAQQISEVSPENLARIGLLALCRDVERNVRLNLLVEVVSLQEYEAFKQTSTATVRNSALTSTVKPRLLVKPANLASVYAELAIRS